MMEAYEQKYSARNPVLIIKALMYHKDINFNKPILLVNGNYKWKTVEKRLLEMEKYPGKIFNSLPLFK